MSKVAVIILAGLLIVPALAPPAALASPGQPALKLASANTGGSMESVLSPSLLQPEPPAEELPADLSANSSANLSGDAPDALAPEEFSGSLTALQALAALGNAEAQFELGNRCLAAEGDEGDPQEAAKWFARAAAQGHAGAQYSLALCYEQGSGVEKDLAQAAHWYRQAAEQGDPVAQFSLALCYSRGQGVALDYAQAAYWYEQAARQDNAEAQYNLGVLYDEGRVGPPWQAPRPDHEKAVYWYSRAAELGNADAQYNLAVSYDIGEGTAQNRDKALFWYLKAAEQNYPNAQFNLGVFFANAPRPDYEQAARWHARAAERGDREAQFYLAEFYEQGKGLPRDDDQAAFWYRSAADNGQPQAALRLALRFAQGRGVDADAWQGLVYVLYFRELIRSEEPRVAPGPEELALAQRLERRFAARVGRARYTAAVAEARSMHAQVLEQSRKEAADAEF